MKISLNWLKKFFPIRFSPKELAERLTMAGIEVEAMEGSGDEAVFTLSVTPNRADCLSILGIAKEIAAIQGKVFQTKQTPPPKGTGASKDFLKVKVLDSQGCPRYMARVIRGVRIASSPSWLQERLKKVGLRPINNVVDCTNYCLWELGHPLHAFDYEFLKGGEIVVRKEKGPSRFVTLDGMERLCEDSDLFICDARDPVALAGIMGGANSQVRETTKTIVLEAAYFDPRRIHRTSKRLKLMTDSSYRFERGVDPNGVPNALHRLTQLILETAGGTPTSDWVDIYPKRIKPSSLFVSLAEVERHLGLKISVVELKRILATLGMQAKANSQGLSVSVPTFRPDISSPIDLIEEVARLKGYDKIPATLPKIQMNLPQRPMEACAELIATECLTSLGYFETCHLSFTSLKKAEAFAPDAQTIVQLSNPLSEDHLVLRPSLMPTLLDAVAFNLNRQRKEIKLFELKKVFAGPPDNITETKHLGVVATGEEWSPQWQLKSKPVDFFSLKGLLTQLSESLHLSPLRFVAADPLHSIYYKDQKLGWIGLLSPQMLTTWEIEIPVYAFEINWEVLAKASGQVAIRFQPLSKYPYIERDVALVVDGSLPAGKIEEAIQKFKNPWIQKVQFFDLFKGGNLPPEKKSLALNIRYASSERTLTHSEVNEAHTRLISRLEQELSAQLRK